MYPSGSHSDMLLCISGTRYHTRENESIPTFIGVVPTQGERPFGSSMLGGRRGGRKCERTDIALVGGMRDGLKSGGTITTNFSSSMTWFATTDEIGKLAAIEFFLYISMTR